MKKRFLSLALAAVMALGLTVPAMAYTTPDFSDVPSDHWAYSAIMEMADKEVVKGVGEGRFDPEGTVTAEMFIVLVGRVIFPDILPEGDDWSGPYIAKFRGKDYDCLWNTKITDETMKEPITRYDMAQIFVNTREMFGVEVFSNYSIQYGSSVRDEGIDPQALLDLAEESEARENFADYEDFPAQYRVAVGAAYDMGLMQGDQNACFNGADATTRMEAAMVISRLIKRKEGAAAARPLRMELVTQDLAALLPDDPTEEEVADAVFQVSERWALNLFSTGGTAAFTKDERESIRTSLGISEETFQNACQAGSSRRIRVTQAEQGAKPLDAQSIHTLTVEKLGFYLSYIEDLEPRDVKAVMDKKGLTYADIDAAYRAADQAAQNAFHVYTRKHMLFDVPHIALTAAKLARAEGHDIFTFHTFGEVIRINNGMPVDYAKLHLGIFDEEGQLVGTPELDELGRWEIDLAVRTDHLDEKFTLRLLETYEACGYYLTPEMVPKNLVQSETMESLICNGFTFHLSEAKKR